jgi:hypothetical protein
MTQKIWIGVYLASAALWAQPPSTAITGLPGEKGAYYRGASGWVSLPVKPMLAFKEGWAKEMLGFGRQDAVVEMPGPHAAIRISNARPTFYMRGLPAGSRLYLVQGVEREEYREIRMSMPRRFPNTPRFKPGELNEVELEAVSNDVVSVKPKGDLKPGEYVLVSVVDPSYRWIRVGFDFGVTGGK